MLYVCLGAFSTRIVITGLETYRPSEKGGKKRLPHNDFIYDISWNLSVRSDFAKIRQQYNFTRIPQYISTIGLGNRRRAVFEVRTVTEEATDY